MTPVPWWEGAADEPATAIPASDLTPLMKADRRPQRSEEQARLVFAVSELARNRFGQALWRGFVAERNRLDGHGGLTDDETTKLAADQSAAVMGRGPRPYPKDWRVVVEVVRVCLADDAYARSRALRGLRRMWTEVTGTPPPGSDGGGGDRTPASAPVTEDPTPREPRRRSRVTVWLAVAAAVVLLAGSGLAIWVFRAGAEPPDGTTVPPPLPESLAAEALAQRKLLEVAERTRQLDGPPARGLYTYVHLRVTSVDATSPAARKPRTVHDERLWWAVDRPGRRVTVKSEPGRPPGSPHREDLEPGDLREFSVDVPDTPGTLGELLAANQPALLGAAGRLRAVADLNMFHALNPAQRAAVLHVLAYTRGLDYRGQEADCAGRSGLAVSADATVGGLRPVREKLVFDSRNGELLGWESATVADPESPVAYQCTVFLERWHTDRIG